jgi:hypothetical protein
MRLAAIQSGYFTAAQALKEGYSYQAQKYHFDQGNWQKVDRGLYRLPEWPVAERDDLVRCHLWSKGRAVVSHETALAVHDLGDLNPERLHLTVPPRFKQQARGLALHRGDLPASDVVEHAGFRITTVLRSLLDVAAGNLDLERLASAVGEALAKGLVTRHALRERADEMGARAALRIERAIARKAA